MSVLRRDDCGEKNASEVSAQKMLTTKTTIVRANGAFNDEQQQKTPKTGETETETFASRRRDQKKMRPMSRPRESAVL